MFLMNAGQFTQRRSRLLSFPTAQTMISVNDFVTTCCNISIGFIYLSASSICSTVTLNCHINNKKQKSITENLLYVPMEKSNLRRRYKCRQLTRLSRARRTMLWVGYSMIYVLGCIINRKKVDLFRLRHSIIIFLIGIAHKNLGYL